MRRRVLVASSVTPSFLLKSMSAAVNGAVAPLAAASVNSRTCSGLNPMVIGLLLIEPAATPPGAMICVCCAGNGVGTSNTGASRSLQRPGLSHITFSELGEEAAEELVVPPCSLELTLYRALGALQPSQVQDQPTKQADIFRPLVFPIALAVLVHCHVQDPVQSILDTPLRPCDLDEARCRKRCAQQILRRFCAGLTLGFTRPDHLPDCRQPRPRMLVLRLADVGAYLAGAGLDAAVIGIDLRVSCFAQPVWVLHK